MGIKASFSGSDGQSKAFDFDSPSSASRLADFFKVQDVNDERHASKRNQPDEDIGKASLKPGDQPDYLEKKLDPMGSIEAGINGIRLKGDANSGGGGFLNRIYSMVNGIRNWWTLRDIDPPVSGKVVGPAFGTNLLDSDSSSVDTNNETAFSFFAVSRIATKIDDTCNMETVYAFLREVQVSAGGRVIGIGPERRQFIGNFLLSGAQMGARPIVLSNGTAGSTILAAIQFGPTDILERQKRDGKFPDGVGEDAEDIPSRSTFTVRTNTCPNYTFGYAVNTGGGA